MIYHICKRSGTKVLLRSTITVSRRQYFFGCYILYNLPVSCVLLLFCFVLGFVICGRGSDKKLEAASIARRGRQTATEGSTHRSQGENASASIPSYRMYGIVSCHTVHELSRNVVQYERHRGKQEEGEEPLSKRQIQPDVGRDGRACLARPNSHNSRSRQVRIDIFIEDERGPQ